MKLCVIGATGATGLSFVEQALAQGHEVTALVRVAARLPLSHARLSVIQGDVRDAAAAERAVRGADAVICLLGVRLGEPAGTTRSQGTQVLVDAMARAGTRRLIAVSAVGARRGRAQQSWPSRWLLPLFIGRERLAEVDRQEDAIIAGALDWTLVRAPRLIDDGSAAAAVTTGPMRLSATLSRPALAAFLLATAEGQSRVRAAVAIENGRQPAITTYKLFGKMARKASSIR